MNTENNLLQTREEEGGTFERTLVASEFINWLLQEGEMATREEAEQLGRRLLEHGIIQHGEKDGDYYFKTHTLLIQNLFSSTLKINFTSCRSHDLCHTHCDCISPGSIFCGCVLGRPDLTRRAIFDTE